MPVVTDLPEPSRPDPIRVDPLLSHARRTREGVEVVLVLPEATFERSQARLRLRAAAPDDDTTHGFPARVETLPQGRRVVAVVPDDAELAGTWRLQLRLGPRRDPQGLRTRLVLVPGRPVALLPSFAESALGN